MTAYYNENDKFAAAWLRELIKAKLIAEGDVDERSIEEVRASDLEGYTQCHFFAGIGGWSYAFRLAGWPDDKPAWTGSCPCQPLSVAGQRQGHADQRHLWPTFYRLIAVCCPPVVFGEQVASKDGREWFAAVRADLEGVGYACGAAGLPACSVGAPHRRQRIFFVADAASQWHGKSGHAGETGNQTWRSGTVCGGSDGCLGHADSSRSAKFSGRRNESARLTKASFWSECDWLPCRDAKARPVEPGTFPMAHGVPARVGRLRGYGNAIVPEAAAAFIKAYTEILA